MHSLHAALSCTALLALVLIPVALYLTQRLQPLVCAAEAHLYLCAAALPPALAACYILGLPSLPRPWLLLALLAVMQSSSVSLAVLSLHRLFLHQVEFGIVLPLPGVPKLPAVPELPTPADLAHAPEVSHA